jgi:RNA polymerase sigma-70 factor (sigma-E family)
MTDQPAEATLSSTSGLIGDLYRREYASLLRLAILLAGDRESAEDIVHDSFAALQSRWTTLSDRGSAAGYLRVSVVNGSRSMHRRRGTGRRYLRMSEPDSVSPADAAFLLEEDHRAVAGEVRRLPRRQQQVLVLRYWSDMSESQIAAVLGISTGTVKSTASRAVKTIGRRLGVDDA